MIPLDATEKWSVSLDEYAGRFLNEHELCDYLALPEEQRQKQLKALLEAPIAQFTAVNEVFFRARWAEVLRAVGSAQPLTLLEIGSGDTDMIPQMMDRVCPGSRYITANMNRQLTASLREKMRDLSIELVVIEEDAALLEQRLAAESVDVVAFQHAVNDVVQAILCGQAGVDTVYCDWMELLPEMIRMMQREVAEQTLEEHAAPAFLALIAQLGRLLKRDGWMVMNHYMFQLDLDWGYPAELWENFMPLARTWLRRLPELEEVNMAGFDPQWWIFLRKKG
jgi:hypothetical protein